MKNANYYTIAKPVFNETNPRYFHLTFIYLSLHYTITANLFGFKPSICIPFEWNCLKCLAIFSTNILTRSAANSLLGCVVS